MKQRMAMLLVTVSLCLGIANYAYAGKFSDGAALDGVTSGDESLAPQTGSDGIEVFSDSAADVGSGSHVLAEQDVQPGDTEQKDYEIDIDIRSGKINLVWTLGNEGNYDYFGMYAIRNIGKKTVTLHTDNTKYTNNGQTFTLQPGEEYQYDFSPALLPPVGYYDDDSFHIYDDTGNIDLTIPITLSISADAPLIALDKTEINLGECYEDDVNIEAQTFTASDITVEGDKFRPFYPELYWRTPGAKDFFEVEGAPWNIMGGGSETFTVKPRENIPPGNYEAYLCLEEENIDSDYGYQVTVKVTLTVLPAIPASPVLTAAVSGNRTTFTWNKPELAKGYQIYICDDGSGKYRRYKTVLKGEAVSYVKKLGYAKNAVFKIRAFNLRQDGTRIYGSFSEPVNIKTATAAPAITSVSARYKNALVINWKNPGGAEGYQIFRSTTRNGTYTRLKTVTKGSTLTYRNVRLKKGQTYYYKIRSFRKDAHGRRVYSSFGKIVGKMCV